MKKILEFIKQHLLIVIIVFVVIMVAIILLIIFNLKTATIVFQVAPHDATIVIDQQLYANNTSYSFKPGKYTATIQKDGFKDQTVEVSLDDNQSIVLSTYLIGEIDGEESLDYYKTNYDDLYYIRDYSNSHPEDEKLKSFITEYDKAQTIQKILPLYYYDPATGDSYYVFYNTDPNQCDAIYCLEIGAPSIDLYYEAIQKITENGYDINYYHIAKRSNNER